MNFYKIFVTILSLKSCIAFSGGPAYHTLVAYHTLNHIPKNQQDMIKENYGYYIGGSLLPDLIYPLHPKYSHSDKFLNDYLRFVLSHCDINQLLDIPCKKLLSHLYGAIVHIRSDLEWHRNLVPSVQAQDLSHLDLSNKKANEILTKGIDFTIHIDRKYKLPEVQHPMQQFLFFLQQQLSNTNKETIQEALQEKLGFSYGIIRSSPKTYIYYSTILRHTIVNLDTSKGGIDYTSKRSANFLKTYFNSLKSSHVSTPQIYLFDTWPLTKGMVLNSQSKNILLRYIPKFR